LSAGPQPQADYLPLWIGGAIRGRVRRDIAVPLRAMPEIAEADIGLRLVAPEGVRGKAARSAALQSVARQLHTLGLIADWRNEPSALLDEQGTEVARCERGAFRTLGMQNRAVHVNGWRPDGSLWVARRSALKRADPGKLDNMAAGGVGAGETLRACALREAWEEAGVPRRLARALDFPGMVIRSLRETRFGPRVARRFRTGGPRRRGGVVPLHGHRRGRGGARRRRVHGRGRARHPRVHRAARLRSRRGVSRVLRARAR
jgi:8-oxo-dGTP pyrophosphatase MutT (NUDIX family)